MRQKIYYFALVCDEFCEIFGVSTDHCLHCQFIINIIFFINAIVRSVLRFISTSNHIHVIINTNFPIWTLNLQHYRLECISYGLGGNRKILSQSGK